LGDVGGAHDQAAVSTGVFAQVAKLQCSLTSSIAAVRRKITGLRKELVVSNNILRMVTKKTDDIAVLADQLATAAVVQRRASTIMWEKLDKALDTFLSARVVPAAAPVGASRIAGGEPAAGEVAPMAPPQTEEEMEIQDAKWVLDLKVRAAVRWGAPSSKFRTL